MIRSRRRLAGAVGADHADLGARVERQRDVLQHRAVGRVEAAELVRGVDELRGHRAIEATGWGSGRHGGSRRTGTSAAGPAGGATFRAVQVRVTGSMSSELCHRAVRSVRLLTATSSDGCTSSSASRGSVSSTTSTSSRCRRSPSVRRRGRGPQLAIDKVARGRCGGSAGRHCPPSIFGILITGVSEDYFATTSSSGPTASSILHRDAPRHHHAPQRVGRHLAEPEDRARQRRQRARRRPGRPERGAAGRARRSGQSRQNTIFSVSDAVVHGRRRRTSTELAVRPDLSGGKVGAFWLISVVISRVLEVNALGLIRGSQGRQGPQPASPTRIGARTRIIAGVRAVGDLLAPHGALLQGLTQRTAPPTSARSDSIDTVSDGERRLHALVAGDVAEHRVGAGGEVDRCRLIDLPGATWSWSRAARLAGRRPGAPVWVHLLTVRDVRDRDVAGRRGVGPACRT